MDKELLLKQAQRILNRFSSDSFSAITEGVEFLRNYAGERSAFYKNISALKPLEYRYSTTSDAARAALQGFIAYVQNDLIGGISIERKVQIETVSDFLGQANVLLNTSDVHPATPIMIVGAALEEFLRNWVEESGLPIEDKPSIDSYAKTLRSKELITKQDIKDITSWAGLRNNAAHGKWEEVSDKGRAGLMLEGVNLFMRQYAK